MPLRGSRFRGLPPRGAFSLNCQGEKVGSGTTTRQPRQLEREPTACPAPSPGHPPSSPAPRLGTSSWPWPPPHCLQPSSSETASEAVYASSAAVAKRISDAERAAVAESSSLGGSEEDSAELPAGFWALAPQSARRAGAKPLGEGRGKQAAPPSLTVTPQGRRPRAPIRNHGALSPAPLARRGGLWRAILTRTQ